MKKKNERLPRVSIATAVNVYEQVGELRVPLSIRRVLRRAGVNLPTNATFADSEVLMVHTRALFGDLDALKVVIERIEGPVAARKLPQNRLKP